MTGDDITERAERLRVLLALAGEEPALTAADRDRLGIIESLDLHDQYMIEHHSFTGNDLGLAIYLLAAAHELRRSEWQVLEELLGLLPGGDAPLPRQLMALHGGDSFYEACAHVAYLNWTHPPREGDS